MEEYFSRVCNLSLSEKLRLPQVLLNASGAITGLKEMDYCLSIGYDTPFRQSFELGSSDKLKHPIRMARVLHSNNAFIATGGIGQDAHKFSPSQTDKQFNLSHGYATYKNGSLFRVLRYCKDMYLVYTTSLNNETLELYVEKLSETTSDDYAFYKVDEDSIEKDVVLQNFLKEQGYVDTLMCATANDFYSKYEMNILTGEFTFGDIMTQNGFVVEMETVRQDMSSIVKKYKEQVIDI